MSGPVVGCAAVLSAPALWHSLVVDKMPVSAGLARFLVALALCWLLLSIYHAMIEDPAAAGSEPSGHSASKNAEDKKHDS